MADTPTRGAGTFGRDRLRILGTTQHDDEAIRNGTRWTADRNSPGLGRG